MLTGEQIVEIALAVIGAIVTVSTTWLAYEMRQNTKASNILRATIASLHAVMLHRNEGSE